MLKVVVIVYFGGLICVFGERNFFVKILYKEFNNWFFFSLKSVIFFICFYIGLESDGGCVVGKFWISERYLFIGLEFIRNLYRV